jgi:hypothetical protein
MFIAPVNLYFSGILISIIIVFIFVYSALHNEQSSTFIVECTETVLLAISVMWFLS